MTIVSPEGGTGVDQRRILAVVPRVPSPYSVLLFLHFELIVCVGLCLHLCLSISVCVHAQMHTLTMEVRE